MRTGITQEQVNAAADAILSAGENPTVEKVRIELGTTHGVRVIVRSSANGLAVREDEPLRLAEAGLRPLVATR